MSNVLSYRTPETIAEAAGEHSCLEGTPWEKLGAVIPPNASIDETLEIAGLDWDVIRARSMLQFETSEGETVTMPNPKSFGIVRSSDHAILSPYMGDRYKPIQNRDAFEVFGEFIRAGQMTLETAGSLSGGQHVWCLASFGKGFELADGEVIKGYFLLLQSHLYGHALRAMFTPVRYPGGHTLMQNISLSAGINSKQTYTMSHASVWDERRIQEVHELMGIAERGMDEFERKVRVLARSEMTEEAGVKYLARVFNKQLTATKKLNREEMPKTLLELVQDGDANRVVKKAAQLILDGEVPGFSPTAWGYYNTVAHSFDHVMGHNENTRLETSWLGKNAKKKVEALDLSEVFAAQ